jgi:ABC-2 type transport system ATP-binding protein
VRGIDSAAVGHAAFTAGVELHELRTERADLEQLFFSLTQAQYTAPPAGQVSGQVPPPVGYSPDGPPPGFAPGGPPPPPGYQPGAPAPSPGGAR